MKMRDPVAWMWSDALELIERADRLHRQFFRLGQRSACGPSWEPPMDMFETERQLVILVALPGVRAEQLAISQDGTAIVVRGQRALPAAFNGALIRCLEIPYGHFERRIDLPAQRYALGERSLQDGCLLLMLDKLA